MLLQAPKNTQGGLQRPLLFGLNGIPTRTPNVCRIMAFWAILGGFGPLFYLLWGFPLYITPIYYSSFHFLLHFPNITSSNPIVPQTFSGVSGRSFKVLPRTPNGLGSAARIPKLFNRKSPALKGLGSKVQGSEFRV